MEINIMHNMYIYIYTVYIIYTHVLERPLLKPLEEGNIDTTPLVTVGECCIGKLGQTGVEKAGPNTYSAVRDTGGICH